MGWSQGSEPLSRGLREGQGCRWPRLTGPWSTRTGESSFTLDGWAGLPGNAWQREARRGATASSQARLRTTHTSAG